MIRKLILGFVVSLVLCSVVMAQTTPDDPPIVMPPPTTPPPGYTWPPPPPPIAPPPGATWEQLASLMTATNVGQGANTGRTMTADKGAEALSWYGSTMDLFYTAASVNSLVPVVMFQATATSRSVESDLEFCRFNIDDGDELRLAAIEPLIEGNNLYSIGSSHWNHQNYADAKTCFDLATSWYQSAIDLQIDAREKYQSAIDGEPETSGGALPWRGLLKLHMYLTMLLQMFPGGGVQV